jgi:hypothetical protein
VVADGAWLEQRSSKDSACVYIPRTGRRDSAGWLGNGWGISAVFYTLFFGMAVWVRNHIAIIELLILPLFLLRSRA